MVHNYETVSEAVNALIQRGYTLNFGVNTDMIYCDDTQTHLRADDFVIDEVYRFEGNTDPADETIVYAIASTIDNAKGVLVNGYGSSADPISSELVQKLKITH